MKKILLIALTLMLGLCSYAQVNSDRVSRSGLYANQSISNGTKDDAPVWSMIHTPFSTTDINGNAVNVADTLAAGKYIVVDFSATWCNPCYRFHQSKNLEAIYNQLGSQVCVLWVETDNSTTLDDIYGTGSNTQGDWTHYSDNTPVSYRIIDCSSCHSMVDATGYVPEVAFITPSGYYTQIYGETWGLTISMDNSTAVANIQSLIANAPAAGQAPIVHLSGPDVAFVGQTKTYTASVVSVDQITNVSWKVDGSPVNGDINGATINFTSAGIHTVELDVTNTTGTNGATIAVDVRDGWSFGDDMDYTEDGEFQSSIGYGGNGEISWGVLYPESLMAGRNYVTSVSLYVENPGQYDLRLYQGGTSNPQTLVYENSYNITTTEQWVDLPIYGGAQIDPTKNLWTTFHCNGVNYPATYCPYVGDPNSHLIDGGNGWVEIQTLASSLDNVTWMIKTTTSATAPAFDFALNGPTSGLTGDMLTFKITGPADATYNWTFDGGDPATDTGIETEASWANPGTYTVTVVGSRNGSTVTKTLSVTINDGSITLPFTENFENGLDYWRTVDADGDGYTWMEDNGFDGHSGSCIGSASYINNIGVLTPDNWLITNKFDVPAEGAYIEWWEYGVDNNDYADHYSVYVSYSGNQTSDFNALIFSGEPAAPKTWVKHSRNFAAGSGHAHVAFRHHDVTNMYWLLIDDVKIAAGNGAGINGVDEVKVDLFPNPTSNIVNVKAENYKYTEIYDATGRKVLTSNEGRIDMSSLSNGVYVFRVVTLNGTCNMKVVKK